MRKVFNCKLDTEVRRKPLQEINLAAAFWVSWLRGLDLNQRPLGYEPNELPTAPPRDLGSQIYT